MTVVKSIKKWLFGLFAVSMWTRATCYDQAIDDWFCECLDSGDFFTHIGRYTAKLRGVEVWVANYPYACFTIGAHGGMPSRYTVYRLRKRLLESQVKWAVESIKLVEEIKC